MNAPLPVLTDRMRQVFGLVVDAYLERGNPVGSKAIAPSVSLSPASIRGVMQELEERPEAFAVEAACFAAIEELSVSKSDGAEVSHAAPGRVMVEDGVFDFRRYPHATA